MARFVTAARCVLRDEEGATVIEYGVLIGLLAVVVVASGVLVGQYVRGAFGHLQSEIAASGGPPQ